VPLTSPIRSAFEPDEPFGTDLLLEAANSFCSAVARDPFGGELVVVLQPTDNPFVASADGTCILRAAVSVAVAAGNERLWADAPVEETTEVPTRSMPEVIASAADASGVRAAHVGRVQVDGIDEAIAIWFERDGRVATVADRRLVLAALSDSAARAVALRPEPVPDEPVEVDAPVGPRTFDADDPALDRATGLLTADRFDEVMTTLDCDQAGLLVIDAGGDMDDDAALELADRLVASSARDDLIARLSSDRFAVLSTTSDRDEIVGRARELLDLLAEGDAQLHIALAHEVGFVDLEDMLDITGAAADTARRAGGNPLVLAS